MAGKGRDRQVAFRHRYARQPRKRHTVSRKQPNDSLRRHTRPRTKRDKDRPLSLPLDFNTSCGSVFFEEGVRNPFSSHRPTDSNPAVHISDAPLPPPFPNMRDAPHIPHGRGLPLERVDMVVVGKILVQVGVAVASLAEVHRLHVGEGPAERQLPGSKTKTRRSI